MFRHAADATGINWAGYVFQDYPISDVHTILTKAKDLQDTS